MIDDHRDFMLWEFERTGNEWYLSLAYGVQEIRPPSDKGEPDEA